MKLWMIWRRGERIKHLLTGKIPPATVGRFLQDEEGRRHLIISIEVITVIETDTGLKGLVNFK